MKNDCPQWAGRVPTNRIKRLYTSDANGLLDEQLVDEVGYAMLARCESILVVTEAHNKRRAACPLCSQLISHSWDDDGLLHCADCDWQITWGQYRKTYQKKQLHGGGMEPFLRAFAEDFPKARSPQEKMILIDILLHRYHGEFNENEGRPGALNLVAVKNGKEMIVFLDELAGKGVTEKNLDVAQEWVKKVKREQPPPWQSE